MRWYPLTDKKKPCNCRADRSQVTSVIRVQGRPPGRMIRHYRAEDEAHFWHWWHQSKNLVGNT